MADLTWHGEELVKRIRRLTAARLAAAAQYLRGKVREKLSRPGTKKAEHNMEREEIAGQFASGKLFTKKVFYRKGQTIYGFFRSKPGEPPLKQTGHLRRSIDWELDRINLVARVGTNLKYGKFLELGTSRMQPRPFLRVTLAEEMAAMRAIVESGRAPEQPSVPAA